MKILFSGYAPVHYRCFKPLHQKLAEHPGVEVFVSGGLRTKIKGGYEYDTHKLYDGIDVPKDSVLTVEEIKQMDFDVQFSAHTKLISPRSVGKKIQIFHGVSFRNKAIRPENMGCDHYFVVGPYMLKRFVGAGLMQENDPRVVKVGFMKTDPLVDGSLDSEAVRSQFGLSGQRPVILYAPTGAKLNSLETMGEETIRKLIEENQYDVVVKPHDHPKNKDVNWFDYLKRYEDEHCKIVHPREDIIPLMNVADLLISDASSVVNEYALLDRPILFLDTPVLLEQARDAKHSMLDLDTFGRSGGLVAKNVSDVPDLVSQSLSNPAALSEQRQTIVKNMFYNHGSATAAAMAWMEANVLPNSSSESDETLIPMSASNRS